LKVDLKLAAQRLKNAQNKKANMQAVARKEIARLLANGKEDSARVKVENIIREDNMMEALELTELYCNLLTARFGGVLSLKYCDDSVYDCVSRCCGLPPGLLAMCARCPAFGTN